MNSINLTDKQLEIQKKYRKFTEESIIPVRLKHDREGSFPYKVMEAAWENKILNGPLPLELGGCGYTISEAAVASEELGAGCLGMGITVDTHSLAFLPILLGGSDKQKSDLFSLITGERRLGAFCLTEPEAGSDIGNIQTTAVRSGSGWKLSGFKRFITNGEAAGFHTVFAYTDREKGNRGISAFFVPAETPGVKIVSRMEKMGQLAAVQNEISYTDVELPSEYLIGGEGAGFKLAMETFNRTRILVAALALGNARAAWEYSSGFARNRIQFGKPVTANQEVSFRFAGMLTEIHAARGLVRDAAAAVDCGSPDRAMLASMAKYYASDRGMKICTDAVQMMGGEGYSKEHPVEKMMRDAKLCEIYEGTNEIQKLIISKQIFR